MHSFDSPGPVNPPVPHRPPTPSVASAPLRTANVRGWDRGCAGVAAGLRGPPYGTEVLYAVRAGSMKPGHTIHPLRAGRARLLVRRNASPIQLPRSQGTSARARATDATAFPLRHAATPLPAAFTKCRILTRPESRSPCFFEKKEEFVRFPLREDSLYSENINENRG